jgi:aryl-alcohol dehydrogenase-like predicted oxidoreductase
MARGKKKPDPRIETMVRLPIEVVRALRRTARRRDMTVAQVAREFLMGKREQFSTVELVGWTHDRLVKHQEDYEELFREEGSDSRLIERAIDALSDLHDDWPAEEEESDEDEGEEEDDDEGEDEEDDED